MKNISGKPQNIIIGFFCRIFYLPPKIPQVVQIGITNLCNFDCKMCQRKYLGVKFENMDFVLFKKVVDKLVGVDEINLTGWGEPLIHPKIIEMIKYCKDIGFKTAFTSNGSLLTEDLGEKIIESKLDKITFSIDSVKEEGNLKHIITTQLDNIEKFAAKPNHPKIIIQTTLHKNGLRNIIDVIQYAKKIKADRVNIGRLDIRFNKTLARPTLNEEKEIITKAISFGDKNGIIVEFAPISIDKGLRRLIYFLFKNLLHRRGKYCLKLYNEVYIDTEGNVTPCCALPRYKIGSILNEDLQNIWSSQKFKEFRKLNKKICGECDVLTIK